MKLLKYRRILGFLLALLLSCIYGMAQTYTENQKIERTFHATAETRFELSNKYGTVHLIPWKKDSVRIEVDLYIKSNSASKLEKIKESIAFDFSETKYYIIAKTDFGSKYSNFFSDLKDLSGNIIPSKNQVGINYTVHLPAGLNISITNKYGDIYIDDLKGDASINLSNGDIKINSLEGQANISLNFGKGIINSINNARLNLSYADIEIRSAKQLNIESKSSKIRIQQAELLKTNSRRDRYTLSRLENIFGESYFSEFWIYKLSEEMNFSPKYGEVKIDSIPAEFSYINLNSEYADIDLSFNKGASYELELIRHKDAILRFPGDEESMDTIREEETSIHQKALLGTEDSSPSRVKISAPKKCFISIYNR